MSAGRFSFFSPSGQPNSLPSHRKLDGFSRLALGWHYGTGGPIDQAIINRGKNVTSLLLRAGFSWTDAFPGEDGTVLVTAYAGKDYIGIMVNHDDYSLNHEVDREEALYVESLPVKELEARLKVIAEGIWTTSVSSTPPNLITIEAASTTWPLRSRQAAAECPYSKWTAHNWQALPFALT